MRADAAARLQTAPPHQCCSRRERACTPTTIQISTPKPQGNQTTTNKKTNKSTTNIQDGPKDLFLHQIRCDRGRQYNSRRNVACCGLAVAAKDYGTAARAEQLGQACCMSLCDDARVILRHVAKQTKEKRKENRWDELEIREAGKNHAMKASQQRTNIIQCDNNVRKTCEGRSQRRVQPSPSFSQSVAAQRPRVQADNRAPRKSVRSSDTYPYPKTKQNKKRKNARSTRNKPNKEQTKERKREL